MSEKLVAAIQQDLRTRKHNLSVSFNDPGDDCGTEVSLAMHLVGSHYNEFRVHMNQYTGCFDSQQMRLADPTYNPEDNIPLMIEIVVSKLRPCEDKLEEIEALFYEAMKRDGK